jgi:hypothetical protein
MFTYKGKLRRKKQVENRTEQTKRETVTELQTLLHNGLAWKFDTYRDVCGSEWSATSHGRFITDERALG